MTDRKRGVCASSLKLLLLLLSYLYRGIVSVRSLFFDVGIIGSERVPAPVISVGNLTLGGTGKTPFIIMLEQLLKRKFKKNVAVLIRGYGKDEQVLLRERLEGGPVFVGKDRVRSAYAAVRSAKNVTILLDDGFQHRRIARDLDIVMIDMKNPFGNGKLFPRGVLREPLTALSRASVIILSKSRKEIDPNRLKALISGYNSNLLFMEAEHRPTSFVDLRTCGTLPLDALKGKRALLVSGIADPEYFEETVKKTGPDIKFHVKYPDHHYYRTDDIREVQERCRRIDAECIITTEKDKVKLSMLYDGEGAPPVYALRIEMVITEGEERFIDRLHSLYTRQAA